MKIISTKRRTTIITLIFLLAGCAADGAKYSDANMPPLEPDKARIFFLRESGVYASAQTAKIDLDEKRIGSLAVGGYLFADVPPGKHVAAASDWWTTSSLTFQAKPKTITYLNISASPLSSSALLYLGGAAGVVGSIVGVAVASSSEDGFYKISPLSDSEGKAELTPLSLSQ